MKNAAQKHRTAAAWCQDVDDTGKIYQHVPAGGNSGPYWLSTTIAHRKRVRFGVHKKWYEFTAFFLTHFES